MRVRILAVWLALFALNLVVGVGTALAGNDPPWP